MRKTTFNECSLYTLLWILYYLQGILYPSGSLISQGLLLVILLLSLFYTGISIVKYKLPSFLKVILVFIGLFVIYYMVSMVKPGEIYFGFIMDKKASEVTALKEVLMSLLPIFAYYHFSNKKLITEQNIAPYIICLLILTTLMFFRNQNDLLSQAISVRSQAEEFTNNMSYNFLQLIPILVFLRQKPLMQYVALIYCIVFIVMGMKRGAMLIGAISVLYFLYNTLKNSNKRLKTYITSLTIVSVLLLSYFTINFLNTSDYFQSRIESTIEGNSSARDVIYATLFEHIISRNSIGGIVFGEGLNYSVAVAGDFAHNDWLELGVNMGLLGIIVYILYFISFGITTKRIKYAGQQMQYTALTLSFIIMFVSTFFSMSYSSLFVGLTMAIGFSLSSLQKSNNQFG